MNDREKKIVIASILVIVLLGLGVWVSTLNVGIDDTSASALLSVEQMRKDIPIERVYSDRIIYTSDRGFDEEILIDDCQSRGGVFDECGVKDSSLGESVICSYSCQF